MNRKEVDFEIDTGSGLSIISEATYRNKFLNIKLERTGVMVKTYSEEPLDVLGKINTTVEHRGKTYEGLILYVIKGNGVNLLGRSWLIPIPLDWKRYYTHKINQTVETLK